MDPNSKAFHLHELHKFNERVKDKVAEDIVEHGVPHPDRYVTVQDIHKKLAEAAALLFEVSQELYALGQGPEAARPVPKEDPKQMTIDDVETE